eukprot:TRINITY_DN17631_c0_g1_i1.p1 TRINITY_DN17631_c0_g1~~TRINITY_DN17631_c0_g1_i1.p1  ORF type:complete len:225 (+),score=91.40 TRINITY_DN17631_c0_g1_i1:30-677(+)
MGGCHGNCSGPVKAATLRQKERPTRHAEVQEEAKMSEVADEDDDDGGASASVELSSSGGSSGGGEESSDSLNVETVTRETVRSKEEDEERSLKTAVTGQQMDMITHTEEVPEDHHNPEESPEECPEECLEECPEESPKAPQEEVEEDVIEEELPVPLNDSEQEEDVEQKISDACSEGSSVCFEETLRSVHEEELLEDSVVKEDADADADAEVEPV